MAMATATRTKSRKGASVSRATLCAFSTRKAVKAEMEKLQALVDAKRPK
jgi:hypothetical protein